jgi:hypothetical protein
MTNTLADQLLKAGLVNEKKASQVNKEKKKQRKRQFKTRVVVTDESKLAAQQALIAKQLKSKELNRQKETQAQAKAIVAQINQLITNNAIKVTGDIAFNFVDAGKVKKIYVDEKVQTNLVNGVLSVVKLTDTYKLVPSRIAEKIAQRNPSYVLLQNKKTVKDEEDDYADFKIPDDLMW